MNEILIKILPVNKTIRTQKGKSLIDVLYEHGYLIPSSCGKRGICGKCLIEVETEDKTEKIFVNSCQYTLEQNIVVYLPDTYVNAKKVYKYKKSYQITVKTKINPGIFCNKLKIERSNLLNYSSYTDFLFKNSGKKILSIDVLKKLPEIKKQTGETFVLVTDEEKILDIKKEQDYNGLFGIAIDLGTTTIAMELVNLTSGETVGEISDLNPQILYGDDVISRISWAGQSLEHLEIIHKSVLQGIKNLISQLLENTRISKNDIYSVVISGNTTMIHLLLGISPITLGEYPFTPVLIDSFRTNAHDFNLSTNLESHVYIFPAIGGFVGGDITSGLLALNIPQKTETFLFVDLGTNGEIVVGNKDNFLATSTAVGPAFEGGRIQCGMRASIGAIEKVEINKDDLQIKVIGDTEPIGICGSGLIDLLALLLRLQVIDTTGRMLSDNVENKNIPEKIRERIKKYNGENIFEVAQNKNKKIFLSTRDVRQLQLSCSAIKTGIKLLTKQAGIDFNSYEKVYIAGTFGYHLNKRNLKTIGIIPDGIDDEKILFIGNSSLAGAKCALLDMDLRYEIEKFTRKIKHIDLSTIPDFEEEFAMATFFPELK